MSPAANASPRGKLCWFLSWRQASPGHPEMKFQGRCSRWKTGTFRSWMMSASPDVRARSCDNADNTGLHMACTSAQVESRPGGSRAASPGRNGWSGLPSTTTSASVSAAITQPSNASSANMIRYAAPASGATLPASASNAHSLPMQAPLGTGQSSHSASTKARHSFS